MTTATRDRFYEIPYETLHAELTQFAADIADFKSGKIHPVKFKGIRVAHGVYEQRQLDTYMIRIRCAGSGITPTQLKHVAKLGAAYGSGEVHFTTRQEVQVHDIRIDGIMPVIYGLLDVGLSSRGGGGNTIRNILVPVDSGIKPGEAFDVTPYAMALTSQLITEPDSWNLPRKFKIAFSNDQADVALSQTTCLGYVATLKEGQKGFQVYCAGGMGARPMVGHVLLDWIPDYLAYHVAKSLKVMFDKHGNRRSKFSSRLKFLWKKLDQEAFIDLFMTEFNKIEDDRSLDLVLPTIEDKGANVNIPVEVPSDVAAFESWKMRYVHPQKQEGLVSIHLPLQLGDLMTEDADILCDFLAPFGDNTIRCDRDQNMRLRNLPVAYLGNVFHMIRSLKQTLADRAPFIGNMINCTGAQTCKLGICLPRGLSTAIRDRLNNSPLDLDQLGEFKLNMSGCPNTCGMHHIADLGFFGKIGRSQAKKDIYPAYNVLTGAKREAGKTEYAQKQGEVAAKHIPDLIYDFLADYLEKKTQYSSYHAYLEAEGNAFVKTLCERYKHVPEYDEDNTFYTDFGAKKRLSLDELGTAECSAGIFDMIDVDKKAIQKIEKNFDKTSSPDDDLYKIIFHSARMLLVTRGIDPKDDTSIFKSFNQHFIRTGLISQDYVTLIEAASKAKSGPFKDHADDVFSLAKAVTQLYKDMDDSLRFKNDKGEVIDDAEKTSVSSACRKKDLRGVSCPMNFVKTKLVLETMEAGAELEVYLDDGEPIQNVPGSVEQEGHTILKKTRADEGHWLVRIKKS